MARKRNNKKVGKMLVRLGIVGYFVVVYLTCHLTMIDWSDVGMILDNLVAHIAGHPFQIFPIDWQWVGIVTFAYALLMAYAQVCFEKAKQTMPGEESGTSEWNEDYDKFASKYAEPFGKKEITQKTGWLDKKTGAPWRKQKKISGLQEEVDERTTSIVVALLNLLRRKWGRVRGKWMDRWLDVKGKWLDFWEGVFGGNKGDEEEGVDPDFRVPTERERKKYEKVCAWEKKLDMNLDKWKPKACLEERKRLEAEERKRQFIESERIRELRRNKGMNARKSTVKYEATLVPVNRNMILSQNVALSMDGRATRKNCNTLILGGSGAGKTRFYLKPNLMQLNCSYVITDPSGEILQTMGKFLENAGYEIKVINLTNMDQSHCYNPFNYVREDADILVMIDVLTKNLTPPDSHTSDPFWPKAQAALLQAICFYLYKECRPSERNFTNVMKLLRAAVINDDGPGERNSPLDIIFSDLEKKDPNHIAVMQYSIFKQAPGKTASTILTCAQVDLAPFNLDTIANLTGVDTIDMGTIGLRPTALFCITPTAKTTYNWIISLAYTQLFETLYYTAETKCKGLRLPVHVRFLLDEFANIGQIPDFEQKLATMRKYEISCAIIIQNMAQLETMYKESWKTIVGNCDEFIYLGGHETSSTEYVSKMLGKQTIKSKNSSKTYGRQGSHNISLNATGRDLMDPSEIAHMSDQDCLVMIKGVMPFFDKKYDLLKHPNYHLTGDAEDSLIYDIAAEIQTPKNNVFGNKHQKERRKLEHQAMEDSRRADREARLTTRRTAALADRDTAVTPENLVKAGLMYDNDFPQDEAMFADMEVSAHVPADEFAVPEEMAEQMNDNFGEFLDGEAQVLHGSKRSIASRGVGTRNSTMRQEPGVAGLRPGMAPVGTQELEEREDIGTDGDDLDSGLHRGEGVDDGLEDFGDEILGGLEDTVGKIGDEGAGAVADAIFAGEMNGLFVHHLKGLNDVDFAVLSMAVTGMGHEDEIIELGIVDKNGELLYTSLFKNEEPLSAESAEKYQLTEAELAESPKFIDEWKKIQEVLKGKRLVVFGEEEVIRLFRQTLTRYCTDIGESDALFENCIDAMKVYIDLRPTSRNQASLMDCCTGLGLAADGLQSALEESKLVLRMLRELDKFKTASAAMTYIEGLCKG